jgi:hypothetical protein
VAKSIALTFPAGMLIGQALALGILSNNTQVLTGYAASTGIAIAAGGVDSISGPGSTTGNPYLVNGSAGLPGGNFATIGDTSDVNPGAGGVSTASGAGGGGSVTVAQLLATGGMQLSNLCSLFTFGQQGGD